MVGWPELSIPVEAGRTVTIRFAEMLNQDGTLYTGNYRSARSTDEYIPARTGTAAWKPTFTFHGFRYVELSGLADGAEPEAGWVKGLVLHSDLPRVGNFESSHAKLNRLQSNIIWGQRGNFVDIPTDCPQRDERLGWTADAQVFCPTSMFNYDCLSFWKSWLRSVRDDQMPSGMIPNVIPALPNIDEPWWQNGGSPGWVDAAIIIPWEVYVRSGDRSVLVENFEMMRRHTECWRAQAVDGLIPEKKAFGDWLQPYADRQEGDTPAALLGTAFYARSAQIMAHACRVLGRPSDEYEKEAAFVQRAFTARWFGSDGRLINAPETQTAYLLAIEFNLIPEQLQAAAAACLVELIHAADDHLRTGFLGTPFVASVLDRMGYADLAYMILFKETYPSWFYSINQGATTMWERWNSYSHEDGFGDANMNSFNHYAYGAVGQWMAERVAGLAPDPAVPGYKHFFVRPLPRGPLTSARAELETPYGKAVSAWEKCGNEFVLSVTVPPNTTATIELPAGDVQDVVAGEHEFRFSEA
jgi:alpha-L-rhamnosidase